MAVDKETVGLQRDHILSVWGQTRKPLDCRETTYYLYGSGQGSRWITERPHTICMAVDKEAVGLQRDHILSVWQWTRKPLDYRETTYYLYGSGQGSRWITERPHTICMAADKEAVGLQRDHILSVWQQTRKPLDCRETTYYLYGSRQGSRWIAERPHTICMAVDKEAVGLQRDHILSVWQWTRKPLDYRETTYYLYGGRQGSRWIAERPHTICMAVDKEVVGLQRDHILSVWQWTRKPLDYRETTYYLYGSGQGSRWITERPHTICMAVDKEAVGLQRDHILSVWQQTRKPLDCRETTYYLYGSRQGSPWIAERPHTICMAADKEAVGLQRDHILSVWQWTRKLLDYRETTYYLYGSRQGSRWITERPHTICMAVDKEAIGLQRDHILSVRQWTRKPLDYQETTYYLYGSGQGSRWIAERPHTICMAVDKEAVGLQRDHILSVWQWTRKPLDCRETTYYLYGSRQGSRWITERPHTICMAVDKEAIGLQRDHILSVRQWTRKPLDYQETTYYLYGSRQGSRWIAERPHTICMAVDKEAIGLQRDHILSVWQQTRKPLDYRETTYYLYGSGQGSRWITERPHTICMGADKEAVGLQRDHILSVWQQTRKPLDCRETTYYLYGSGQGNRWIAERPDTICMAVDKETVGLQRDHILSVWQWTRKPLDYQETTYYLYGSGQGSRWIAERPHTICMAVDKEALGLQRDHILSVWQWTRKPLDYRETTYYLYGSRQGSHWIAERPHTICMAVDKEAIGLQRDHILSVWQWTRKPLDCRETTYYLYGSGQGSHWITERPHTICMAVDKEAVGLQRDHIQSVWQRTRKPLDCRETTYYLYGSGQGSHWIAERPHTICMAADKEAVGLQRDHILSVWQWTRKPLDCRETTYYLYGSSQGSRWIAERPHTICMAVDKEAVGLQRDHILSVWQQTRKPLDCRETTYYLYGSGQGSRWIAERPHTICMAVDKEAVGLQRDHILSVWQWTRKPLDCRETTYYLYGSGQGSRWIAERPHTICMAVDKEALGLQRDHILSVWQWTRKPLDCRETTYYLYGSGQGSRWIAERPHTICMAVDKEAVGLQRDHILSVWQWTRKPLDCRETTYYLYGSGQGSRWIAERPHTICMAVDKEAVGLQRDHILSVWQWTRKPLDCRETTYYLYGSGQGSRWIAERPHTICMAADKEAVGLQRDHILSVWQWTRKPLDCRETTYYLYGSGQGSRWIAERPHTICMAVDKEAVGL